MTTYLRGAVLSRPYGKRYLPFRTPPRVPAARATALTCVGYVVWAVLLYFWAYALLRWGPGALSEAARAVGSWVSGLIWH
jgi:hypothetical protein